MVGIFRGWNFCELLKVGFLWSKLSRIVGNDNDTPIGNDGSVLIENFCGYSFCELPQNREIRESFHPRKIPAIRYYKMCVKLAC